MSFVQFLGIALVVTGGFLYLTAVSLRRCILSNGRLKKQLREALLSEDLLKRKVVAIEELQARVPSVEPAWGSDPSSEPSRTAVALKEEEEALATLRAERDQIERSVRTPGPFFGAARFMITDDNNFYDYTPWTVHCSKTQK